MIELDSIDQLDLATYIRPGDGIIFGQGTGEPLGLTQKLVEQRAQYSGAGIFFGCGFSKTFAPEHADHLRFTASGLLHVEIPAGGIFYFQLVQVFKGA